MFQWTIFENLPLEDGTSEEQAEREIMIIKLADAVKTINVNVHNFGITDKHKVISPSPLGGETHTLVFFHEVFVNVMFPDATTAKPAHPMRAKVCACWQAAVLLYHVLWQKVVGTTVEDRKEYAHDVFLASQCLLDAVTKCCGTDHSCVYFHICIWHLAAIAFKYGALGNFAAEAIEAYNCQSKKEPQNGQMLKGSSSHASARNNTTKGVPAQVMMGKAVRDNLQGDYPLRLRMKASNQIPVAGWKEMAKSGEFRIDKAAIERSSKNDLMEHFGLK